VSLPFGAGKRISFKDIDVHYHFISSLFLGFTPCPWIETKVELTVHEADESAS
jgi:hypothetical protein